MYRVLVVDDSPETQLIIRETLVDQVFKVSMASTALDAEKKIDRDDFDLVLLDVMLPDCDGFRFCTRLQADPRTRHLPVIFLSGKTAVDDRVHGLMLGAVDYITKPFEPKELRVRVESKIRKSHETREQENYYSKGNLVFNLSFQKLVWLQEGAETEIYVTPTEFKLLLFMAKNEGQVFSRDQLMTNIWGENAFRADRLIDVHLCKLRKKIRPCGYSIHPVPKLGYALSRDS